MKIIPFSSYLAPFFINNLDKDRDYLSNYALRNYEFFNTGIFVILKRIFKIMYTLARQNILFINLYYRFSSCRGLRRKTRVLAPDQTSKQNTKIISSAISSQQISVKNSESK